MDSGASSTSSGVCPACASSGYSGSSEPSESSGDSEAPAGPASCAPGSRRERSTSVVFLGLFTLELVGLLELHFEEHAPGALITTAGDALWWGYVTATTVGYGDQFPITTGGRVVGILMLNVGVALFATFSGFLQTCSSRSRSQHPSHRPSSRICKRRSGMSSGSTPSKQASSKDCELSWPISVRRQGRPCGVRLGRDEPEAPALRIAKRSEVGTLCVVASEAAGPSGPEGC